MISGLGRAACVGALVAAVAPHGAQAAPSALESSAALGSARSVQAFSAKDDRGDAKQVSQYLDLSVSERASIDIRSVTITDRGATARFTVALRSVGEGKRWRQSVNVLFEATRPGEDWSGTVGLTNERPEITGFAEYYSTDPGDENSYCTPLTAKLRPGKDTVSIDVPQECLPTSTGSLKVVTYTLADSGRGTRVLSKDVLDKKKPVVFG